MPPTDDPITTIESTRLTLRDAVYILGGLVTIIGIAITGNGAYWHLSGRQDLADQRMSSLLDEKKEITARRDKQIDELQRKNADQDQQITAMRNDYGSVQVQIGKIETKLDTSIDLLRQVAERGGGGK